MVGIIRFSCESIEHTMTEKELLDDSPKDMGKDFGWDLLGGFGTDSSCVFTVAPNTTLLQFTGRTENGSCGHLRRWTSIALLLFLYVLTAEYTNAVPFFRQRNNFWDICGELPRHSHNPTRLLQWLKDIFLLFTTRLKRGNVKVETLTVIQRGRTWGWHKKLHVGIPGRTMCSAKQAAVCMSIRQEKGWCCREGSYERLWKERWSGENYQVYPCLEVGG